MKRILATVLFFGILFGSMGLVQAFDYLYLSDDEMTVFGDRIKWWPGDTLNGYIRTNGAFACMPGTDFHGMAIQHQPMPVCSGVVVTEDIVEFPETLDDLRQASASQGHFYVLPQQQARVVLDTTHADVYLWPEGTPFDSANHFMVSFAGNVVMFFDMRLTIHGVVHGHVTVGASGTIGIADNILYADADSMGVVPESSPNLFWLASEGEIKILNTVANGRENSGGQGSQQTNPDSTSIVLDGLYIALGESFTFENQNDPDSGYVCACTPDDRGTIYLYGGLAQRRRGYLHRSNRSSTGYLKQFRYDSRWLTRGDWVFDWTRPPTGTDTLNFGRVSPDETVWDTAYVYTAYTSQLSGAYATFPWYSPGGSPTMGDSFTIPVRFTPPHLGEFSGLLSVYLSGQTKQIVLLGEGADLAAPASPALTSAFALSAYPNPFNPTTTIRYELRPGKRGQLTIADALGQIVASFDLTPGPGPHSLTFDANDLATGLYFARLISESDVRVQKLLLLK